MEFAAQCSLTTQQISCKHTSGLDCRMHSQGGSACFLQCRLTASWHVRAGVPEVGQKSEAELKQALDLEFILKPHDGSADSVLNLNLAPSFITYNRSTIENITEFFKTDKVCRNQGVEIVRSLT